MQIVETDEHLKSFIEEYENSLSSDSSRVLMIPVPGSKKIHPKMDVLSFLFIKFLNGGSWIVSKAHNEATNEYYDQFYQHVFTKRGRYHCLDIKQFLHLVPESRSCLDQIYDVNLQQHIYGESTVETTFDVPNRYNKLHRPLCYVPIYEIATQVHRMASKAFKVLRGGNPLYDTKVYLRHRDSLVMPFYNMERVGIHVDKKTFVQHYGKSKTHLIDDDSLVYPMYDLYNTSTGRPSNAFGGVNYAAVNKSDGTRKSYTPRSKKNGRLLMFDYDAFHLRLIAKLIRYTKFEERNVKSVHEYFGKKYYFPDTKQQLTSQQYKESKVRSFQNLYGNADSHEGKTGYFGQVAAFKEKLWNIYRKHGQLKTPVFKRTVIKRVDDASKSKIFNYLLQSFETEIMAIIMKRVQKRIKGKDHIKLCMYTYDSLLFDISNPPSEKTIQLVKGCMESIPGLKVDYTTSDRTYHELD
mgnify:CR=1 FL=1